MLIGNPSQLENGGINSETCTSLWKHESLLSWKDTTLLGWVHFEVHFELKNINVGLET